MRKKLLQGQAGEAFFLSDHEDLGVISTNIEPYIDDPLASDDDDDMYGEGAPLAREGNEDGLTLASLEARFLRREPVENWGVSSSFN